MKRWKISPIARVTLIYFLVGVLWILLSDKALILLFPDPSTALKIQTYKGWLFIIITSWLLYVLMKASRETEKRTKERMGEQNKFLVEGLPGAVFIDSFEDPQPSRYISPRIRDLVGYTPEEWMAGQDLWENSLHPDDKERVLAEDARTNKTGEPFRIEYRLRHRDGHYVWIKEDASNIRDKDGKPQFWQGILLDISEQKKVEEALERRDAILRTVGFAAEQFLKSGNWEESIGRVLERLGRTTGVSRVYVFKRDISNKKGTFVSQIYEWCNEGIDAQIDNPELQNLDFAKAGYGRWAGQFDRGLAVYGNVREFPEEERQLLQAQNILSLICIPIQIGGDWWGFIGFDHCQMEKQWDEAEIEALRAAANTLGTAIERVQLFDLDRMRLRQAEILRDVTVEMTSSFEMGKLLDKIFDLLGQLVEFDSASIETLHQGFFEIVAGRNISPELVGQKYPSNVVEWGDGEAIRHTIIVPDVLEDERFIKFEQSNYIRSWMGIPLIVQDKLIGFLNLDKRTPNFFTSEHASLAQTFANQAAIAIENARLFEREKQRRSEAEILSRATSSLANMQDTHDLLEKILDWLQELVTYDSASIMLRQEEDVILAACRNLSGNFTVGQKFPLTQKWKSIEMTRKPLIIEDAQKADIFEKWDGSEYIRGWMAIAMFTQDKLTGFINLDSKTPGAFSEAHEGLFQTFANQAATAIENVRLYTETRQRVEELEMVSRISSSLRAARDTNEMLPILLKEIRSSIDTNEIGIWLFDANQNLLFSKAASGRIANLPKSTFTISEGIVGRVFASGDPHVSPEFFNDTMAYPENRDFIGGGWASLTVPIRATSEMIGAIVVGIPAPRRIEPHHQRLLTTIAEIAGNAIHRSNLYEKGEEQIRRLTTLREMDTAIASSLDLRITLNIIVEHMTNKMGASAAAILVFNPESQMLDYFAARGFISREVNRTSISIGSGIAGQILLNRKPIHIKKWAREEGSQAAFLAAEQFSSYYATPIISKGAVRGILEIFFKEPFTPSSDWLDFVQTLAGQAAIAIDNAQLFINLQRTNQELSLAYDTTLEGWGKALELRDKETQGHTRRVTNLTVELARQMGIPEADLTHIRRGTLLHDIGKMGVPDNILRKPGPLTNDELIEMRKHPQYAYDLLSPIPYLRPTLEIPYYHHEWWNGEGYPNGVSGEEIPLSARIFAVVDVWDALLSDRPYRKAWKEEEVMKYINDLSGRQFDPRVVEAFKNMLAKNPNLIRSNSPEE